MTDYQKTMLVLPDEAAETLKGLTGAQRDQYIAALRAEGWTFQSLGAPVGITRARIGQIVQKTILDPAQVAGLPLPSPPLREVFEATRAAVPMPEPEALQRILELQPIAQSVRGSSTEGRAEAEEYTRLIWEQHTERGVSLYRMSKLLSDYPEQYGKTTHSALSSRMRRYGYKPITTPNKTSTPIIAANRVQ